jgi:hypothetical protein
VDIPARKRQVIGRIFAHGPSDRAKNAGHSRRPRLGRFVEGS